MITIPKDTKNKDIVKGQTASVSGTVIAASEKDGANVLIQTADGTRLSVRSESVTVTADAPPASPAPAEIAPNKGK